MKRISTYLWLAAALYGCSGSAPKSNDTVAVDTSHFDAPAIAKSDTATDERFKQFWDQFKTAVNHKDVASINKLTYFPIGGVRLCYVPTGKADSAGLSSAEFDKLNKQIFDDETSWLTKTPADSLYLYEQKQDDKHLPLQKITDKNTPVYQYGVVYARANKGGDKSLYFGSVKGTYKLIWIDCDGDINGHTH